MGGREAFAAYGTWCEAEQLPADERQSQTAFGTCMKARFRDVGSSRKVIYAGVGLRPAGGQDTSSAADSAS